MDDNKNISQIVFNKIKEQGIKPISKNIFNTKKVLVWSFAGFAVLVGAVSFAVMLSNITSNDWYLINKLGYTFMFKSLPYFWFICLIIFALLGEYYYRRTYLGYRHRVTMVIGAYIIITILFGTILHIFNFGEKVEGFVFNNIPIYRNVVFNKELTWTQPEVGLISGKILEIDNNYIKITDLKDNVWIINKENAVVAPGVKMKVGETIKIVGDMDSDTDDGFNAEQIRPWIGLGPYSYRCIMR